MRILPAYNVNQSRRQVLLGPGRSRSGPRAPGKFIPFLAIAIPAHGCPLADDRVALTQQVKEANDIVDIVGSYIPLRPAGPIFKGLCPFHDDQKPSFDVDPRRQRYKCWACNAYGDVIKFVQEFVKISFLEARELLARRAGISLDSLKKAPHGPSRALMLDVTRWAAEQFQQCLLDAEEAEAARNYLGERKLTGETVRRFGLGYAPNQWDWLVQKAVRDKLSFEMLQTVGLVAKKTEGTGYYDRFRDRVIFPIRDFQGQTVGFGGRILPSSPLSAKEGTPKYYNSSETPLFSKSNQLYGIDQAKQAAAKAGFLAVVEGYTDVLMAHQHGVQNVVATMGTALNARHVQKLRGVAERVVLVFDSDEGGDKGVDRAMEVFVSHEMDLRVATLPEGLDPCDLLSAQGPEPFQKALAGAEDVFEYKLARVWKEAQAGVEGQRLAVEKILGILAAAPEERTVKLELMVNRIAHRLNLKEETVWARLRELRGKRADRAAPRPQLPPEETQERTAPAARHEVELLEVLLADGALVSRAVSEVAPADMEHPELRSLLEGLYRLHAEGLQPDLDHLRMRLDNERLLDRAQLFRERGLAQRDRLGYLEAVLARFRERREKRRLEDLRNQAMMVADNHEASRLILEQLHKPNP